MNDSITDLGKSLASEYSNNMTRWSALEFTLIDDDLPAASFGLADDIMRLEEGWQPFAELVQTLQTDFIPQDLLAVSQATPLPPEQQLKSPGFVRKVENHPVTLPAQTGFIGLPVDLPAGSKNPPPEPSPAKDNSSNNTKLPVQDSTGEFPEAEGISSPHSKHEDLSFGSPENSVQPLAKNISAASDTKILKTPQKDLFKPVEMQDLPSLEELAIPLAQTPPQKPEQETPNPPDIYSDSIWEQPLQSLGDFASLIRHPDIEKDEKAKLPGQALMTIGNVEPGSTEQSRQTEDQSNWFPKSINTSGASNPNFEMVSLTGSQEYFPAAQQTPDYKQQEQWFQQQTHQIAPDTDDLLEALTDRILRDFHRYYP